MTSSPAVMAAVVVCPEGNAQPPADAAAAGMSWARPLDECHHPVAHRLSDAQAGKAQRGGPDPLSPGSPCDDAGQRCEDIGDGAAAGVGHTSGQRPGDVRAMAERPGQESVVRPQRSAILADHHHGEDAECHVGAQTYGARQVGCVAPVHEAASSGRRRLEPIHRPTDRDHRLSVSIDSSATSPPTSTPATTSCG
ncbi:hypothetical protein SALBM311S_06148 [Streptomyces alboniger]